MIRCSVKLPGRIGASFQFVSSVTGSSLSSRSFLQTWRTIMKARPSGKVVKKQRELDEALRMGATTKHVAANKLMASTLHSLLNFEIEFTPASSQSVLEDGNSKYILLKPDNEPTGKECLSQNDKSSNDNERKKTMRSGICVVSKRRLDDSKKYSLGGKRRRNKN